MAKNMCQKREERKNKPVEEKTNTTNINWYPGHMAKTKRLIVENIDLIDVVYEVVDARMPFSSKIKDLDEFIKNKKRIMIMTKVDLCDMNETKKWIKYYEEKGYKVIPMNIETNFNSKQIINATNEIMEEENQKRINKGMQKRRTRVLVVGIPNVGKSTLINRLAGKKAVNVGNKPGVTKELSWIRINEDVELLDSPGILWPKIDEGNIAYNLACLTAIKEEILPIYDVIEYLLKTLDTYYRDILVKRYGEIEIDEDIIVTLDAIGKRRGCLIKGGEIDYEKTIGIIMNDIKSGIIRGITFDRFEDLTNE